MFGGLLEVIKSLKVKNAIISKQAEKSANFEEFIKIVKEKKIKLLIVESKGSNSSLKIEKSLNFHFLWPNNSKIVNENVLNNNSIVCTLHYKKFSMLFTGDIEEKAEREILHEYKNNSGVLNSTILKVAHHGSKTSSTQEFIEAVQPKISLIGVGENNKFGHPNNEILKRLETCGTKIYRTDQMGEIAMEVNNKGKIKIKTNCK